MVHKCVVYCNVGDASLVVGGVFFNTQALGRGVVAHVTQLCSSWESMQSTPVCEWCHSIVTHRCVVYRSVVVAEARKAAARLNPDQRQQRWTNLQMAIRVTSPVLLAPLWEGVPP